MIKSTKYSSFLNQLKKNNIENSESKLYWLLEENYSEDIFNEKFCRLLNNEPLQYILGYWEFYGYSFFVNPSVLIPRPETEELIESILNIFSKKIDYFNEKRVIVDLCTGSGIIIITLFLELKKLLAKKYFENITFIATDISQDALLVAKKNSEKLTDNSIIFYQSDLFDFTNKNKYIKIDDFNKDSNNSNKKNIIYDNKQFFSEKIDILVSNPPYISIDDFKNLSEDVKKEPQIALTDGFDGLSIIKKIIDYSIFNQIDYLFMEIGYNQRESLENYLEELLKEKSKNSLLKYDNFNKLNDLSENNLNKQSYNFSIKKDISNNDRIFFMENFFCS